MNSFSKKAAIHLLPDLDEVNWFNLKLFSVVGLLFDSLQTYFFWRHLHVLFYNVNVFNKGMSL